MEHVFIIISNSSCSNNNEWKSTETIRCHWWKATKYSIDSNIVLKYNITIIESHNISVKFVVLLYLQYPTTVVILQRRIWIKQIVNQIFILIQW